MPGNFDRLSKGERWWAAEAVLRAGGLVLLAGAYRVAIWAHRLITGAAPHQATAGEFAVVGAAVVMLAGGLALCLEGPGLLHRLPIPGMRRA